MLHYYSGHSKFRASLDEALVEKMLFVRENNCHGMVVNDQEDDDIMAVFDENYDD